MVDGVKVFKKTAPNGKVTAFLSRRDFVDHITHTSPVDGVIVVDNGYLRGRRVFARVMVTFRYGREEDEMMGLHFFKEFELVNIEIVPNTSPFDVTDVQDRLLKKLGANAHPFSISLPQKAPCSVTLNSVDEYTNQPMGVIYDLRLYVADSKEKRPHKRNSVSFAVRRVQFAPIGANLRRPQIVVSKGFTLSPGRLTLEVCLDREIFCHGQAVEAHLSITNSTKKTVKTIKTQIVQHVEVIVTNSQFSRIVASLQSREGCPVTPGSTLVKTFTLLPLTSSNRKHFGIALDGQMKDQDANLASSTMIAVGKNVHDALGIVVSYSVLVKLDCGALGGELTADLPFKLMHSDPACRRAPLRKTQSTDNIEFEEFAHLRRGQSVAED